MLRGKSDKDGQDQTTEEVELTLTELQRRRIAGEARRAAREATAQWALEHLPHRSAPPNVQVVAAWLMTLRDLQDFHANVLREGSVDRINASVELHWGGSVSRKRLSGGRIHRMFGPKEMSGSFEDSMLVLARAFCNYSASDEIHEIRESNWMILVPVVSDREGITDRIYVHKAQRGSVIEQAVREMRSLGELFARDEEAREGRRQHGRQLMDRQLAIAVAGALGHQRSLKQVYDKTYAETFEARRAEILDGGQPKKSRRPWRR